VLLPVLAGTAQALPADATATSTPVGTWAATVTLSNGSESAILQFTNDNRLCLSTANSRGTGTWHSTSTNTFTYEGREVLDNGQYVDITQSAVQTGNSFSSSGTGTLHNADGTVIAESHTTVAAHRDHLDWR
jgi:hypothetical protein